MRPPTNIRALALVTTLALAACFTAPAARAQGVHVGLIPATQTVGPGTDFDLEVDATQAGSQFNGFDLVVTFDPVALTFLPTSPTSLQQGCQMTGGCSAACGSTFHRFAAAADSMAITDILLCNQVALTGPGQLYKLRFHASSTPQITTVHFRRATFYNAGLYVNPVVTADAQVTIGTQVGVGDGALPTRLAVRAEPNPAPGALTFEIAADRAGEQSLEVHDVTGRLVRRIDGGWQAAGVRRVAWQGTDEQGARLPSGIYLVTLRAHGDMTRVRVALIR